MTTVYRVENLEEEGPYTSGRGPSEMAEEHMDHLHPTPFIDGLATPACMWGITEREVCGFQYESSLYAWFEGWERELNEHGFSVAVYDVPAEYVRHGGHQSVFNKSKAKLLTRAALKVKEYA